MMKKQMIFALAAVAAMASGSAFAYEGGDWRTTIGLTNVNPEQTNGDITVGPDTLDLKVGDATGLSFTGAYFFTDSLALELLASLPFEHDVTVAGLSGLTTKQLPPTLNLQWHFNNSSPVTPYLGVGMNYTTFFSTKTYGALAEAISPVDVDMDDSFGYSLQAGLDYAFTDQVFMNVDLRYISIESDVTADGSKVGTAEINPTIVGVSLGYKF